MSIQFKTGVYLSVSGLHEDLAVHEGNLAAKNNPAQATFHLQKLSFKIAEQNANCRAKVLIQLYCLSST